MKASCGVPFRGIAPCAKGRVRQSGPVGHHPEVAAGRDLFSGPSYSHQVAPHAATPETHTLHLEGLLAKLRLVVALDGKVALQLLGAKAVTQLVMPQLLAARAEAVGAGVIHEHPPGPALGQQARDTDQMVAEGVIGIGRVDGSAVLGGPVEAQADLARWSARIATHSHGSLSGRGPYRGSSSSQWSQAAQKP